MGGHAVYACPDCGAETVITVGPATPLRFFYCACRTFVELARDVLEGAPRG